MPQSKRAIYENGSLRFLDPVDLTEGQLIHVLLVPESEQYSAPEDREPVIASGLGSAANQAASRWLDGTKQWLIALRHEITAILVTLFHFVRTNLFIRKYAWALVPFAVVMVLQFDNHMFFHLFDSYDMPQHFLNVQSVMYTGQMPKTLADSYEAFQGPLFYVLSAWITEIGIHLAPDGFMNVMPVVLLLLSVIWMCMVVKLVQDTLRRASWYLKALTASSVMLLPMIIEVNVMFGTDIAVLLVGTMAVMSMYYMVRSGKQGSVKHWIRSAALIGLTIAFKTNGLALAAVYGGLAAYVVLDYLLLHQARNAIKIAFVSVLCTPMMIIPAALNTKHTIDVAGNPYGAIVPPGNMWDVVSPSFFLTFDTTIFPDPFLWSPGDGSYWSLQYVTLYGDYYYHWHNRAYDTYPDSAMTASRMMPIEHFNTQVDIMVWAIPMALIMVFGFIYACFRIIRNRHRALRDGSIFIVLLGIMANAAQIQRFAVFPDFRAVVLHARFLSYFYPIMFIVGVMWFWKVIGRRSALGTLATLILAGAMLGFSFLAFKLMWLPPVS